MTTAYLTVGPVTYIEPQLECEHAQYQGSGTPSHQAALKNQPPSDADQEHRDAREQADLCAQRQMAQAARSQANYTLFGLILLFGTLVFTAWAAISARGAVVATRDTARVTREIGEAQVRAYLSIEEATFAIDKALSYPIVTLRFLNSGNSPSRDLRISFRSCYRIGATAREQPSFAPLAPRDSGFGYDIRSNSERPITTRLTNFTLTADEMRRIQKGKMATFECIMRIEFVDVFGREFSEDQHWQCPISLTERTPLSRVPFTGFSMSLPEYRKKR